MSSIAELNLRVEALKRLISIATSSTGQSRRVANFLLAWWNAERDGGFDFTDLWNVDAEIADDMLSVVALIASHRHYPDEYGFGPVFEELVTQWRRPCKRRDRA